METASGGVTTLSPDFRPLQVPVDQTLGLDCEFREVGVMLVMFHWRENYDIRWLLINWSLAGVQRAGQCWLLSEGHLDCHTARLVANHLLPSVFPAEQFEGVLD